MTPYPTKDLLNLFGNGRHDVALSWGGTTLTRPEHFRSGFGPNKQPNQNYIFLSFWTEPKTGPNQLISVWFGLVFFPSKPVQIEIIMVEFFLGFLLTIFFNTFIFVLFSIFQKINSLFWSPCPEVKPNKKIHKTKGKERKEVILLQKNKEKIKSYWNVKSSKSMEEKKTYLRDERQEKHR